MVDEEAWIALGGDIQEGATGRLRQATAQEAPEGRVRASKVVDEPAVRLHSFELVADACGAPGQQQIRTRVALSRRRHDTKSVGFLHSTNG